MSAVPKIVPISDLRKDAAGVIRRTATSREPVFVTQRGRPTAVMVSPQAYERTQHELEILRLLARGETEIEAGVGHDIDEVLAEGRKLLDEA
ncbi:MAG: type II toxin-antitoxin system Phd/YefM family antitoxin [Actinobacteria bacterium]|nr:MAG: type II toxin-antitoxin system Phd/YefM family antitoxin [Actinomycetota bacterium]